MPNQPIILNAWHQHPEQQFADTPSCQHRVSDPSIDSSERPQQTTATSPVQQPLSVATSLQLPPQAIVTPTALLGSGSYGEVWEVKYRGKYFAAKKYYERYVSSTQLRDAFGKEQRMLSKLNHPNIVAYFGICRLSMDDSSVIVMERLESNLSTFLEVKNPALKTRISIMLHVACGLEHVHSQDPTIIHRDLTATNVLITADGTAKIGDFSKSCLRDVTITSELLTSNPGTLDYMPPEALAGNAYDDKLDVFSFGHLSIYAIIQHRPHPLLRPVYIKDGHKKARTELERREKYIVEMQGKLERDKHPLLDIVKACLNDEPENRPSMKNILGTLSTTEFSILDTV